MTFSSNSLLFKMAWLLDPLGSVESFIVRLALILASVCVIPIICLLALDLGIFFTRLSFNLGSLIFRVINRQLASPSLTSLQKSPIITAPSSRNTIVSRPNTASSHTPTKCSPSPPPSPNFKKQWIPECHNFVLHRRRASLVAANVAANVAASVAVSLEASTYKNPACNILESSPQLLVPSSI